MKVNEFLNIARKIANETPTKYKLGGVGQHEGKKFLFDCGGLIKSILWGFNFDYSQYRGGAIYESNGVEDKGCNDFFDEYCYDVSSDFSNIQPGELVVMDGHIGIADENRKCIEATAAWESKVLISEIGMNGERTRNGRQVYSWGLHGKLKFLEYDAPKPEPIPTPKPEPTPEQQFKFNVGDKVVLSGHLYKNANGEGQGVYKKDCVCTILLRHEGIKPYNVDADNPGSYEGWVAECNLRLYEEPKKKLDIGVKVKTTGIGNSQACGKGRNARVGLVGTISNKLDGNPYPYLINDNDGPLGWYKAEDLEII